MRQPESPTPIQRFVARTLEFSFLFRTYDAFLKAFPPLRIVTAITDRELRGNLITELTEMRSGLAMALPLPTAAQTIQVALDERIITSEMIVAKAGCAGLVDVLGPAPVWEFATTPPWWSAEPDAETGNASAVEKTAALIRFARELRLFAAKDAVDRLTLRAMLECFERETILDAFVRFERDPSAPTAYDALFDALDPATYVGKIPLQTIWSNFILPLVAEPNRLVRMQSGEENVEMVSGDEVTDGWTDEKRDNPNAPEATSSESRVRLDLPVHVGVAGSSVHPKAPEASSAEAPDAATTDGADDPASRPSDSFHPPTEHVPWSDELPSSDTSPQPDQPFPSPDTMDGVFGSGADANDALPSAAPADPEATALDRPDETDVPSAHPFSVPPRPESNDVRVSIAPATLDDPDVLAALATETSEEEKPGDRILVREDELFEDENEPESDSPPGAQPEAVRHQAPYLSDADFERAGGAARNDEGSSSSGSLTLDGRIEVVRILTTVPFLSKEGGLKPLDLKSIDRTLLTRGSIGLHFILTEALMEIDAKEYAKICGKKKNESSPENTGKSADKSSPENTGKSADKSELARCLCYEVRKTSQEAARRLYDIFDRMSCMIRSIPPGAPTGSSVSRVSPLPELRGGSVAASGSGLKSSPSLPLPKIPRPSPSGPRPSTGKLPSSPSSARPSRPGGTKS